MRPVKRRKIWLLVPGIVSMLVGTVASAEADEPLHLSGEAVSFPVSISAAAADPPLNCLTNLGPWSFNGYRRQNGQWYGSWSWNARLECSSDAVFLSAVGHLVKLPTKTFFGGPPGRCGIDAPSPTRTPGCRSVAMPTQYQYCDPCNGAWTLKGTFIMRAQSGALLWPLVDQYQGCVPQLGKRMVCNRYYSRAPGLLTRYVAL